jgi:hypothetical protein
MNLFIFPAFPNDKNGYSIAVKNDYERLVPTENDIVAIYANAQIENGTNYTFLRRPRLFSMRRIINVLQGRVSCELGIADIKQFANMNFDNIFCGDVVFYRALKKMFPDHKMQVRFHNCFARIKDRNDILKTKLGLRFSMNMNALYHLEKEIFNDENVVKIFISDEDKAYYQLMTGRAKDSFTWSIPLQQEKMMARRPITMPITYDNKVVWFGGLDSHKIDSVKWFIEQVYPIVKSSIPSVEFHLWGKGTSKMNDPSKNIFGHGFFDRTGMPCPSKALYINPDIIGGGVKIKLKTYFESGVPFITTPFGYEGYPIELVDNHYCYCVEPNLWAQCIISILTS